MIQSPGPLPKATADYPLPLDDGVIHGVCPHDCPDTCSVLIRVRDGRVTAVDGNPEHPVTRGVICRKFSLAPEAVYHPDRILQPMRRQGPKGSGTFEPIDWEEAVATIAMRWGDIAATDGPESILPFFGSGTEGVINGRIAGRRFFNRLGSLQLDRTICTKAGRTGFHYTMGTSMGADPRATADCRLIINWGNNIACTSIHQQILTREARAAGARLVIINPVRVRGSDDADLVLQPRPGTDAALAMGLMHLLVAGRQYDEAFVERHTTGFEALRERLADYDPDRVEAITGVAAADLRRLADWYAQLRPALIHIGPGCQRHSNGGMTIRTIACLPALTGDWRWPGGGAYYPTSTVFPVDLSPLEGKQMRPTPARGYNMIDLATLLAAEKPKPCIRSLYVFNGNPATTLYNQNRLRPALAREDLFTVVHDRFLTDTARYADIVLPATSPFEQTDLFFSYYHFGVLLNRPAIAPLGAARSNLDTFNALATALGFDDPCFGRDPWTEIADVLALDEPALDGVTLDRLLQENWCQADLEGAHARVRNGGFPTPSGRIEFYSAQMAADGFDPLPGYEPLRESPEADPAHCGRYPLYLLTPSACSFHKTTRTRTHGWTRWDRRPTLVLHPDDAAARGIGDGEPVRVRNDRGDCRLWAAVDPAIRPGVVVAPGLWRDADCPGVTGANATTPDFTEPMAGGSCFNTNLVEVSPCPEAGDGG